ncbi:MAG: signal peptidase II [Patescibacteria group bacterium]
MNLTRRASLGVAGVFVLFCLDRALKWWALNVLADSGLFVIKEKLGFIFTKNYGISYSILLPQALLVFVLAVVIVALVFIALIAYRKHEWWIVFPSAYIIIGAFSNALDRLKYGYVVDYMTLTGWPIFNIADVLILAGAVWLAVRVIRRPIIS